MWSHRRSPAPVRRRAGASRLIGRVVLMTAVLTGSVVFAQGVRAASGAAYSFANVELSGHGWGHGIGMGQWGALGYSLDGYSYQEILSHYYGSLTDGAKTSVSALTGSGDSTSVKIDIQEVDGSQTVLASGSAFKVGAIEFVPGQAAKFVPTSASDSSFNVYKGLGNGCGATDWVEMTTNVVKPTAVPVAAEPYPATGNLASEVIQVCENGKGEGFRGSIEGTANSSDQLRTVDIVPLEQYVADVTPSESPAYWATVGPAGAQGEPEGFQSLEAQAVAARSYVMSALGGWGGYADSCDLECQSYPGIKYENPLATTAVRDTAGVVVKLPNGAPATTFYSSSTGGWTVASTYSAVPDAGDAVCYSQSACNPHHDWTATIPVTAIEARFPSIGTLESIQVTQRDGHGDFGGRALEMSVAGSSGSVPMTGSTFASDFASYGVQSYWFEITNEASGGIGGYWMAAADGGVFAFGNAGFAGSMGGRHLNEPIVGMAPTHDQKGYWLVASDGGIFSFGDAGFYGSMGGRRLNEPIVGMAVTPDGKGYWLVASDGGIFSFGDAGFYQSMGGRHLNKPVVGMTPTRDGKGYWLVASDGGIFSFGDAKFYGSTGDLVLNQPITAMAHDSQGTGYWMVASDGGVFAFGSSAYEGSLPGLGTKNDTAVSILPTEDGLGYLIVCGNGAAYDMGDAPQLGDVLSAVPAYAGRIVAGASSGS
jgi:SpoIID/LytB domain protein